MRKGFGRLMAVAALAAACAVVGTGCGAPDDDTLLRFLGFQSSGASGSGSASVIQGDVRDGAPLTVDATFENQTKFLGPAGGGTGITIYRVDIDYDLAGFDPPSASYPVSLYAAPVAAGAGDATGGGTVVLSDIPVVPASLKQWLIDRNASGSAGVIEMTATVDFLARTDLGEKLTVGGSLAVSLTDAGGGGSTPSEPTLTIAATDPEATDDPVSNGQFTVYRNGTTAGALTVSYDVTGDATSGTDYRALSGSLSLSSGTTNATIDLIPIADTAVEAPETVRVTLRDGSGFALGYPRAATVTIRDN